MDKSRRFKITLAIVSLVFIVLGVILLVLKATPVTLVAYIAGGGVVLVGVAHVFRFFKKSGRAVQNDETSFKDSDGNLAFAILFLAVAIYIFVFPQTLWGMLPLLTGFCILFGSIRKLQMSFGMKMVFENAWLVFTVISLISSVAAILLIIDPFSGNVSAIFWPIAMLWDGVTGFVILIASALSSDEFRARKDARMAKSNAKAEAKAAKKAAKNANLPNELPVVEIEGTEVTDETGQPTIYEENNWN